MTNTYIYYVYAYLRSTDSTTAKAGTPYYIGKGKHKRAWAKHRFKIPNKSHIVILESNLSEIGALALERRMIQWYGKKSDGTGILINLADGGEGTTGGGGYKQTDYTKTKRKTTNLEKYGDENISKNADIKEKIKSTTVENHGVEFAMQNAEVAAKSLKTRKSKYGTANNYDKNKSTLLEKYGVTHMMQIPEVQEKHRIEKKQKSSREIVKKLRELKTSTRIELGLKSGYWQKPTDFLEQVWEKYLSMQSSIL